MTIPKQVQVQVGISFVSVANARTYLARETAASSFEEIRRACEEEWESWLGRFTVAGGTPEQRRMFYSMLYRLLGAPTDLGIDEENPFWKSGVRQFTDIYCLWDSIRNLGYLSTNVPKGSVSRHLPSNATGTASISNSAAWETVY